MTTLTKHEGEAAVVLSQYTEEAVHQALARLPVSQREVLVRRVFQHMTITEVAEVLGRSRGAVKQLQHRGVRNLSRIVVVAQGQPDHFPTS
jgi:RNA polymerase sigma-70 factor (ECF subfamily)